LILDKNEAICLILGLTQDKIVSSITKLNKLLARLNLHMIPVDIKFSLNKFGSYDADLTNIKENEFFEIESYTYKGKPCRKVIMKPEGKELFKSATKKLEKIFSEKDFNSLKDEINGLDKLDAKSISNNEHKKLLVDVDDRTHLEQKLNVINVEMYDLYSDIDKIEKDTLSGIKLRALIEYGYFLAKFLKNVRFKTMFDSDEYDFDANMMHYYFIYALGEAIPFLEEQIKIRDRDDKKINKFYQFIINSAKQEYPFSLENKDLNKLIQKCC